MNVLGSSLKPSSLEAEIAFDYVANAEANAIVNAILPDNIKLPKDLTIKTARQGKKVMINVECGECLLTFIATVDDLLEAISTAERSVSAVKENTNDLWTAANVMHLPWNVITQCTSPKNPAIMLRQLRETDITHSEIEVGWCIEMLDIKLIRNNPGLIRRNLEKRGDPSIVKQLDEMIRYDEEWRQLLTQANELRHRRRMVTEEIAKLKKEGKNTGETVIEAKNIAEHIKKLEKMVEDRKEKSNSILRRLPNLLHESVPIGKDESANKIVRIVGKQPEFAFPPRNHMEIAQSLDLIDTERAAKAAGHGFYYLRGALALLDLAILRYAVDFLSQRGYLLIEPPFMLSRKAYLGATDLEFFEEQLYKIDSDELYMIATAEHPLAAYFMDEVVEKKDLPAKLVGFSTNFRKEVGTHGKYTKGLFRVHQFNKVEQFIFCLPQDSWTLHEELQKNAEDLYDGLGLHFRTVNVCTGDIGSLAAKRYDIEVWMADGTYREAGSNSNCTDYQARRLNIRYREKKGVAPAGFVHTLNNTALATSRTMIAVLEQHQQEDGSVLIPKALRPYMNGMEKIAKS